MEKFPNVLFLMSDEHRFDVSGFMGNDIINTPNLDALSEDAVIFDNAYTPYPVCVPARQCMAMGQYSTQCGVRYYADDLKPESRTFARQFTETGYKTIASGKLHHHGMDQMQGWQIRVAGDCMIDLPYFKPKNTPALKKYKGMKWSESEEIKHAGPGYSGYARRDNLAVQGLKDMIYEHFSDNLYGRATPDQPVMMYMGLLNPHYPYFADEELFNYYLDKVEPYKITEPFDHPFLRKCPNEKGPVVVGEQISEEELKRAMAAYYANVETIDRQFGEIITELKNAGQNIDDWIIIYTSDHGEMLGEHSVWEKQKFFEGSARVPLFIRYPKKFKPKRVKENVNIIDLFATLCELCNVPMPKGRASRSLVELLSGDNSNWENVTYSEYVNNLMIKKDNLKYHSYEKGSEVLFDLDADATESKNFINEEKYKDDVKYFRKKRREFYKTSLKRTIERKLKIYK